MKIKRFQEGGAMPADTGAAAPVDNMGGAPMGPEGAAQDPMMAIVQLFMDGLQNQDCNALAQGAQMFLELVQQAQDGAEGQPVFAKGGRLVSRKQASLKLVRE